VVGCPPHTESGGGAMKHRLVFVVAVALAVLLVEAAAAGPGTAAQPPDGGLAPLIGCTGVGQPCTMDDGCPGIKACQNNEIVCIYRGTGSIPCTACGSSYSSTSPPSSWVAAGRKSAGLSGISARKA